MPKCRFCDHVIAPGVYQCPECGAPVDSVTPDIVADLEQQVRSLVRDKRKLEAVKVYKDQTGVSLKEAKDAVEAIENDERATGLGEPTGEMETELLRLLHGGQKIQAVKLYKQRTGVQLIEAKQAVEALAARHGLVSRGGGCAGVLVAMLMAAVFGAIILANASLCLGQRQPGPESAASPGTVGRTFLIDEHAYEQLRARVRSQDAAIKTWADQLHHRAEQLCRSPAPAVTDKRFTPHSPSRDPHDYVSIATYWWPDPDSPDGLPYTSRDGQLSPDLKLYDRARWEDAVDGIITLVKAAYFFEEPRFAKEAASRIRRWFLDPETRMNPHLKYGQMIPGRCTGRQYGVIDFSLYLPAVLDHIQWLTSLDESPWTAADQQSMSDWCDRFLTWLENDEFGRQEEAATNNHATYYDRMVVSLALFLNRQERARRQLEKTRQRIVQQIEPDGSMPRELRRTCSFGYTVMNTRGFVDLAWMSRRVDLDLWAYSGDDGRSIPAAVDFLYRLACSPNPWPYEQIEPVDWRMIWPVLEKSEAFSGQRFDAASLAHRMPADFDPDAFPLVEPIHPFGRLRSPRIEIDGE